VTWKMRENTGDEHFIVRGVPSGFRVLVQRLEEGDMNGPGACVEGCKAGVPNVLACH
jgi:hypothetical protein